MSEKLATPVSLDGADCDAILDAAEKTARNPAELPALLEAIKALEAKRELGQWSDDDQATFDAIRKGQNLVVGNDAGYYPVHPLDRHRPLPGEPPRRILWQGDPGQRGQRDIVVVDQQPIPPAQIRRLVERVVLRPIDIHGWQASPFITFEIRHPRWHVEQEGWAAEPDSTKPNNGAWLLSGMDQPITWFQYSQDAAYVAACVNAMVRLDRDTARYAPINPLFPGDIARQGIGGLIRRLVSSILPSERFERDTAPPELRALGARLQDELRDFVQQSWPHRFKPPASKEG